MFYFLGYEKKEYTNKAGQSVTGYNVFFAKSFDTGSSCAGVRPMLRFDSSRKSLGFLYVSEDVFKRLNLLSLKVFAPVNLSFNEYGGIDSCKSM